MRAATLRKPSYFLVFALVGLAATLVGFARTFFVPLAAGTFTAPIGVHIHGAFAFAWVLLFVLQAALVQARRFQAHRTIGYLGGVVALGVSVTMVPAGLFQVDRDLRLGLGGTAYSSMLGILTSGALFLGLVIAGIVHRRRGAHHKRYLLLATIVVLWPAWFRFRHYFPSVPHPEIWFALVLADSLIVIAWAWEYYRYRRIHPVLLWGGLLIILEQSLEVYLFDSPVWRQLGTIVYGLFT
ncbi:hypothetical protein [Flaviaesturariibacter amylovorans]|uniref:DUF2306 domain-containing protein n=1 Tax=Flaviaesturariibacter amylovorans TaxID=1084520 RepID=A0ABP8HU95_9BACT